MNSLLAGASVLVIVAHYDDEVLFCGGLLATLRPVFEDLTVVIATNIETTSAPREVPAVPSVQEAERRRLRLEAFAELCVRVDANFTELNLPNLPQSITREERIYHDRKAEISDAIHVAGLGVMGDVVITHGENGEYGHPQHSCVHDAVVESLPSAVWGAGLTFGHPDTFDYEFRFDRSRKMALIDLYRNQSYRGWWTPEDDARLSTWTTGTEWYCRTSG
ncbi:PIG-L family deacetylase [Micromonospora zamorensis]|uniref:PIG-L family deacetylase n=1 Tax=Micromonospora zamorensis TaxID=709883 RepID=UPI00371631C2